MVCDGCDAFFHITRIARPHARETPIWGKPVTCVTAALQTGMKAAVVEL